MHRRSYFNYMLASGPCGWLYVNVTNDLMRRVDEHKQKLIDGYTAEHGIDQLVWFEGHQYIDRAILGEKASSVGVGSGSSRWSKRAILGGPVSTPVCSRLGLWPSGRCS